MFVQSPIHTESRYVLGFLKEPLEIFFLKYMMGWDKSISSVRSGSIALT